jgi:ABC-type sugar transport system permease subunit
MYDKAFTNLDVGGACAMAIMLFLLVVMLSVALRAVLRSREAT